MADYDQYYIDKAKICEENGQIPAELYTEYDVKKGLRDKNGKGVVTGITKISVTTRTVKESSPGSLRSPGSTATRPSTGRGSPWRVSSPTADTPSKTW